MFGDGNHNNTKLMSKYAPDLAKHRFYILLNDWHWVPMVVLGMILLAIGGLPMMLWGVCMRVVFGLHATWLVNSATHMWGGRRFATKDDSRNSWWVAALTFGEGWHNNHHAHPTSIRHGLAWYEIDHSWILVNILKRVGLVWDLKVAKLDSRVLDREAALSTTATAPDLPRATTPVYHGVTMNRLTLAAVPVLILSLAPAPRPTPRISLRVREGRRGTGLRGLSWRPPGIRPACYGGRLGIHRR